MDHPNATAILEKVLSINDLKKHYGSIRAVDGISLEVQKGSVFGLLGPNGSGKTTTLSILLDVVKSDSGSYQWFGKPPSKESRKRIGAILEQPVFYPYLTAYTNLRIVADIKDADPQEIDKVLSITGLSERRFSRFRTYSYGMKQRLAIASALLGKPDVLIFDEPTNGLDPGGIAEIRLLINELSQEGYTILLASHLLDEVQKTCSHVAVLNKGKVLYQGTVEEVLYAGNTVEIASTGNKELEITVNESGLAVNVTADGPLLVVNLREGVSIEQFHKYLVERGIILNHLAMRKFSLEDKFLELLREES